MDDKIKQLLERYEQIVSKENQGKSEKFELRELNQHLIKKYNK